MAAGDHDEVKGAPRSRRSVVLRVAAVVALALVVLLLLWDWNWFKGPIERRIQAATGREFSIAGDLDVELHLFRPTVVADGVRLGNAAWSEETEMFAAERVRLQWAVWRMLRGEVLLPRIELQAPRLLLERGEDGLGNWRFRDEPRETAAEWPRIGELVVHDGRFRFVEHGYDTDFDVAVNSGEVDGSGRAPLLVDGDGRYRAGEFELEGRVDSPLELLPVGDAPVADAGDEVAVAADAYRVDLRARAGTTRARAFGGLAPPIRLDDFDVGFEISGADMAHLYDLFGLAIPKTPPYRLEGRLGRVGSVWHYNGFSGVVGDSDLAGDATIDPSGERTKLTAELRSQRLDFDDLAGFIGGTPRAGEGEAPAPAVPADPARVFPTRDYELSKLRAMDADVRLVAARVNSPKLPLDDMDAHLVLVDGDLRLDPLDFGIADGRITSTLHLDARQTPLAGEADVHVRRLELSQLAPEGAPESAGRIGGRIQLAGRGNSVAALLANANGEAQIGMGEGRISNLLLELAGIDIYEALKFMIGKDRVIPIRCAYADLAVADGIATSRQFAFDTTDTVLFVEGAVDLGDERFDLRLAPRPKDPSPLSLRSPLRLTGNLKSPKIRPEAGPLLLRGAIAAALYAVAPPAAILALIETGPGEDTGCGADNPRIRAETDAVENAGPASE